MGHNNRLVMSDLGMCVCACVYGLLQQPSGAGLLKPLGAKVLGIARAIRFFALSLLPCASTLFQTTAQTPGPGDSLVWDEL